ncbi:MAG TPA: 2-oxoacid:acceptor oxidoreductase family protein [Methanomassiliicoccales archaeon]|nr:2-oxoacid:acceptor oxidoreductase family protein [Methanomassiliicoccales archaeon]
MSTVEIRWHGRGGQGVVTANEILAGAALREGKYIKAFPEFGPERMGAPIRAFARVSDKPINIHSQVYYPDYVVVLDPTLLTNPTVKEGIKQTGSIIANYPEGNDKLRSVVGDSYSVHSVNATKISMEEIGKPMANTAMLGAFVRISKIVDILTVTSELEAKFAGKFSKEVTEKNVRAVTRAYKEVQ